MDLFKYLFEKLNITVLSNQFWHKLYFCNRYVDIFSREQIRNIDDLFWYLIDPNFPIDTLKYKINMRHKIDMQKIINLLKLFPRDLESKEEVDLLLTLNGLNNNEHLNNR